jgi:hypothetical protein
VDELLGSFSNINYSDINASSQDIYQYAEDYVSLHPELKAAADFCGGKSIIPEQLITFNINITLNILNRIEVFSDMLEDYEYQFGFAIIESESISDSSDDTEYGMEEYKTSTSAISSRRVTLTCAPASSDDASYIKSLSKLDPLPRSIPTYLIQVKPQLLVDGHQLGGDGNAVYLGTKQESIAVLYAPPNSALPDFNFNKELDAGSYYAIGLRLGDPPSEFLEKKEQIVDDVIYRLQSDISVSKDESIGEFLHTIITGYFVQIDSFNKQNALKWQMFYQSMPSISFVHTYLERNTVFGLTRSAAMSDIITDVYERNISISKEGNSERSIDFSKMTGLHSSYWEGKIYSIVLHDDVNVNPLSTVHIQAEAVNSGQTIFTINESNYQNVIDQITGLHRDTKKDIQNVVYSGKIVIIHDSPVQRGKWLGFGYIVFDPLTGSGVYMIDGGTRGGGTGCALTEFDAVSRYAGDYAEWCVQNPTLCNILNALEDSVVWKSGNKLLQALKSAINVFTFWKRVNENPNLEMPQRVGLCAMALVGEIGFGAIAALTAGTLGKALAVTLAIFLFSAIMLSWGLLLENIYRDASQSNSDIELPYIALLNN